MVGESDGSSAMGTKTKLSGEKNMEKYVPKQNQWIDILVCVVGVAVVAPPVGAGATERYREWGRGDTREYRVGSRERGAEQGRREGAVVGVVRDGGGYGGWSQSEGAVVAISQREKREMREEDKRESEGRCFRWWFNEDFRWPLKIIDNLIRR